MFESLYTDHHIYHCCGRFRVRSPLCTCDCGRLEHTSPMGIVASHPDSTPPEDRVLLGDVFETLPQALETFGATARLIHADLGGHNAEKNDIFARKVSPLIEPLLAKGGLMVSSDRMYFDALKEIDLPDDAVQGRCFIYKR